MKGFIIFNSAVLVIVLMLTFNPVVMRNTDQIELENIERQQLHRIIGDLVHENAKLRGQIKSIKEMEL